MPRLDGVVALFTGAGSGLARGIIHRFVEDGARVSLFERDERRLHDVLGGLPSDRAIGVTGDATRRADNERAVADTVEAFGDIGSLETMAAVADRVPALALYPPDRLEPALDEVLAVNLKAPVLATMAALPHLRRSRGSVIITLSTAGFLPGATGALYTIAKHACVGLVRQLAYELAPDVRVNGVVPGGVAGTTVTTASTASDLARPPAGAAFEASVPLGHYGTSQDYAGVYALLADPRDGSVLTGSTVVCDGGVSLVGHGRGALDTILAERTDHDDGVAG